jgi:hypothetical protein
MYRYCRIERLRVFEFFTTRFASVEACLPASNIATLKPQLLQYLYSSPATVGCGVYRFMVSLQLESSMHSVSSPCSFNFARSVRFRRIVLPKSRKNGETHLFLGVQSGRAKSFPTIYESGAFSPFFLT